MRQNLPVTDVEFKFADTANILSTTDLKGRITYINRDFIDVSGFTKSELIGQNHHIVRHPGMPPAVFKMFWNDLRQEKSWMGIVKNRCKNGDHYWVDAYATPIKKDGNIEEYQSVRRQARRDYVKRAERVYQAINAGKKHPAVARKLSLKQKFMLAIAVPYSLLLGLMLGASTSPVLWLATAVALGISLLGSLWLYQPIAKAIDKARSITDDKVARYIYTGTSNEGGSLLLGFKALESENAALIGRINDMSETLSQSAEHLRTAVIQSETGSLEQVDKTEQLSAAIREMTNSIESVSSSANETSAAASHGLGQVNKGKTVIDENARSISDLRQQIEKASDIIGGVSKSSDDIEQILTVIGGIADQTNLLALNAAIEAARAGELGRGFAVVADEVRSLASRTQQSTREIREVIETLQARVREAVDVMVAGSDMASDSVRKSESTAKNLEDILSAINTVSSMSENIATSVERQIRVSQSIAGGITEIKVRSEENLEAAKLSGKVSDKTVNIIRRLDQLTSQFWDGQQQGKNAR